MADLKVKSNVGPSGLANVKLLKNSVKIVFEDGDVFDIAPEEWRMEKGGKFIVTLNKDMTKIIAVRPPKGSYRMKFKEFGNRDRDTNLPAPKFSRGGKREFTDKNGKLRKYNKPDSLIIITALEVIGDPNYEGLTFTYIIPYAFEPSADLMYMDVRAASSNQLEKIVSFFSIFGVDLEETDIPASDNPLPWLEEKLKDAGKVVMGSSDSRAWITSLTDLPL